MQQPFRRSTPSTRRDANRGFTLVEVAVASLALAMLASSLAVTLATSLQTNSAVSERDQALQAARGQMEEILSWPQFLTLVSEFDGDTFPAGPLQGVGQPPEPPGRVLIDDTAPNLPVAVVTVTWEGIQGTETVELRSFIANRSP